MTASSRSPLGFGVITLFYLCILAGGVLLQILYDRTGPFGLSVGIGISLAVLLPVGVAFPRFYWDLFRSVKSAAVLLTLLVLACILGTLLIQDLDLRRAQVYDAGFAAEGEETPVFSDRIQSARFALAESHALLWAMPTEERAKMLAAKVKLSPVEEQQIELRKRAFGAKGSESYREAILATKRRQVEQLTTSNYARKHWPALYRFWLWCKSVHLFDIFEAWWFFLLLGCIALCVVVATIARAPWTVRDFGLAVTHAGVLIVLAGSLTDLLAAKEGYIYFTDGKPDLQVSSKIGDEKNRVYHHLPFQVYLDRFATEYFHELAVERYDWTRRHDGRAIDASNDASARVRPFGVSALFPVREGVSRLYEGGKIKVVVREYKPRVVVRTAVEEVAGGPLRPAVKLGLYNQPTGGRNFFVQGNAEPWLYAFDGRRSVLDMFGARFEYRWAKDAAEYDRLVAAAPVPDNGTLLLRVGGSVARTPVALGETKRIQVGETDVTVEFVTIQSALADAESVSLDRRLQTSEKPTLYLRVNGQPLPVPRDDSEFTRDFDILDGVEFRFDWPNPRDAGMRAILRVVDGEGRAPVLVQADREGRAVAEPLVRGRPVALIGLEGGFLGLEGRVLSARPKRVVEEVSDEEWLGDVGGDEVELSAALRDFLAESGDQGRELEDLFEKILRGNRRVPPHKLAAWRQVASVWEAREPGTGLPVKWEAYLAKHHPDLVASWRTFKGGGGAYVDDRLLAAWADIEITGPWGSVRRQVTPYDRPIGYGPAGERPVYSFGLVQTQQARDWFSVLSVIDKEGWKIKTHAAQVNSPLRYGGFRFFQATAATDRDGLGVSGISVTKNPGVRFMYVGYAVLTVGVCWIFFARPIVDRRRRKRRRREAKA